MESASHPRMEGTCDERFTASSMTVPDGPVERVVIGGSAFCTPGLGRSAGFADQSDRVAVGYAMRRHRSGTALSGRGVSLVDAVCEMLGSPIPAPRLRTRSSPATFSPHL